MHQIGNGFAMERGLGDVQGITISYLQNYEDIHLVGEQTVYYYFIREWFYLH